MNKKGLISILCIILASAFICTISSYAAGNKTKKEIKKSDCKCESAIPDNVQKDSEKSTSFFSAFFIKEASANESVNDCRIFCKVWKWCVGCEEWLPEASQECKDKFSAP